MLVTINVTNKAEWATRSKRGLFAIGANALSRISPYRALYACPTFNRLLPITALDTKGTHRWSMYRRNPKAVEGSFPMEGNLSSSGSRRRLKSLEAGDMAWCCPSLMDTRLRRHEASSYSAGLR
jgi:hypothetical protein